MHVRHRRFLAVLLAVLAIPAVSALDLGSLPVDTPQATPSPSVSSYLHDVSQPIPGVSWMTGISEHHRITMADGVELDAWVVRPDIAGPVPLVLELTPYYGGGDPAATRAVSSAANYPFNLAIAAPFQELIKRGYAFGILSVRGTGASGGCFSIGGPQEAKDMATAIEYFAAQPWSNQAVGAMGVSYDGTAPQDLWVEAPPQLKTIVPISGLSDMYKYNYVNGVTIESTRGFNTYYWLLDGLVPAGLEGGSQLLDPATAPDAAIGEVCKERIDVTAEGFTSLVAGDKTPYWQARDHLAALKADPAKKRASVFYIHGLQDWNVKPHNMEGWIEALQGSNVPFKAWLGQWDHAWPDRSDWITVMTAWFDQFLKNRNTGILDAPRVQVQDDAGKWRNEPRWPATAKKLTLYPQVTGTLGTVQGVGYADYNDYFGQDVNETAPQPDDRVAFVTAPLANDLHLSGMPRFEGIVAATGARANLMLTLAEQLPDGTLRPFNFASLSLNHAQSLERGQPSVAGEPQYAGVNFYPQEDVVHAGNRLVLLAAGDLMFYGQPGPAMAPLATGSQIILDLASSKLVLPNDTTLSYESP
ncbi:CocE/NonD family hydrolase [Lysobacter sp. BMK333-48F3]|uniref:CocE/NonD family hydrolase n=1 Tax=Lysobacter sp. BMK333-48F3 TaxID=2867962 RepID=UPI001C8CAE1D|nr:CocE/NonD family hydrolase [Lysobacter sp. BMK333-48F3]MBX9401682.1 CocE/NonD family hydrolase [Lysobacter sp. BMK333-48F3]